VRKQNQDSDLGLDGVPVAIGSGSRGGLSAVPSTAAADGTRSVPRRVSRARAIVNLWGRGAIVMAKWIAGFWDLRNQRSILPVVTSATLLFIAGLAGLLHWMGPALSDGARYLMSRIALMGAALALPFLADGLVALVRAHSRAVDREVERLSKGGGA
jgi:hypothetical protein